MLRARLLGALEVELNGTAIDSPATQRPWALFAYVALAPGAVSRAELANTFWPEVLDQSARASLRSALWALRRQVGGCLVVDGERVGLDGAWIDVREFQRLAADEPEQALELCRGELLQGLEEEWALAARQRHRERVVELLEHLAETCSDQRRAIEFTKRQVELDPFDEAANRRLIARLDVAGDRAAAVRTYQTLADRLRRELGVAPSPVTRELVSSLRSEPGAEVRPPAQLPGLLPLVGRKHELAELERAWSAASGGSGAVVVIRGEAGIGKTRLATEMRLRAGSSGARTATCAALDLGGTAPFSLWAELIRELLPSLPAPPADAAWPDDLAVLVSELPTHFGRSGRPSIAVAPDLQRTRLFEAVVTLLGWAARDAPLLLVLEDAHDADAPSLELAGYVARRVAAVPVMLVITRRKLPDSADADRLEQALRSRDLLACELTLGPLSSDAVAALARTAAQLGAADVVRVVERAEGNALLTVEAARALTGGEDHVPENLRASVRATLGPLSGDVRRLVEIAAVAARPLEPSEVDQMSLHEGACDALQTGLLTSGEGPIAFRHALLREAAYQEIAEPRRRSLHRRWADTATRPDEVARHLRLAGADQEAVPNLVRAAADARDVAALDQAAAYLEEALAIAPDRADEWLELGEVEAWRGRREPSEEAFQRGLGLLRDGDPLPLARAWLRRGRANHGPICMPRLVLESARSALESLARLDQPTVEERSAALAACAWAEAVAGDLKEAERLLVELDHVAPVTGDLWTYDADHARAHILLRRGRFKDAYGPFVAGAEASDHTGRPDLIYTRWSLAAAAACAAGEPEHALDFLDRGMAAIAGQGLHAIEIQIHAARSFVLRGLGRLADAAAAATAEQAVAERLGQPGLLAMASHDRGLLALDAQDYDRAAELLAASLIDGAPISHPLARLALAEALARGGHPERAVEQVREMVLAPVEPSDFPDALVPRLARVQGLIALASDQPEEAERRLRESVAGWERLLERTIRADSVTAVLADLGRPVVGLVEPERELARAREDLHAIQKGILDVVVS